MSLLTALRAGIAAANTITKPLQVTVTVEPFLGMDGGDRTYGSKVQFPAIIEVAQGSTRTSSGDVVAFRTSVLFLDPFIIISTDDLITLPDGTTGPILAIDGFADAETNARMLSQVRLG